MNGIALDLTKYYERYAFGDLLVYLTWFGADYDDVEPCIAIVPARRRIGHDAVRPCVIALSAAWQYDDPRYLADAAQGIVRCMGMEDNVRNAMRVGEMIHGRLLDLIKMPPKPVERTKAGADVIVTDTESGRRIEAEVPDIIH